MGLTFKKPSSGGGGGTSGTKPKIGANRTPKIKPPDEQDLVGNSAVASKVGKPVEEESPLLASAPKEVVKPPPAPMEQAAVKGAMPVLPPTPSREGRPTIGTGRAPQVPSREGRPPLGTEVAPKQAVIPAPLEQPAVTIAPPLPSTRGPAPEVPSREGRPPLSTDMAPKQAALPGAPLVAPAETIAIPRPQLSRRDAKADLGVRKPASQEPTAPIVQSPAAEEPAKKKKRSLFGGSKKKASSPAASTTLDKVTDKDIKSKKALNGGSAHAVTAVTTKKEIGTSGSKQGFFKANPEQEEAASAVTAGIGQERGNSRMAARAVASSRVDQMLGTNVLTDDKFATVKGQNGLVSPMAEGKQLAKKTWAEVSASDYREAYEPMGPDMAKQEGKKFYKYDGMSAADVDLSRPETQKSIADIGVNDYLSGQVDRHTGNLFIDPVTGKAKGIDNDMAFGTGDYSKKCGKNGIKGLPSLIDEKTAERILTMDREEYEATLRGKAGEEETLNEEEVEQAMNRYADMKAHCAQLKKEGKLVKEWNAETFEASEKEAEQITDFDPGSNLMARAINTQNGASAKH